MTNSDLVTISDYLGDLLTFLLKVTCFRCVHFTLHLVEKPKIAYMTTHINLNST